MRRGNGCQGYRRRGRTTAPRPCSTVDNVSTRRLTFPLSVDGIEQAEYDVSQLHYRCFQSNINMPFHCFDLHRHPPFSAISQKLVAGTKRLRARGPSDQFPHLFAASTRLPDEQSGVTQLWFDQKKKSRGRRSAGKGPSGVRTERPCLFTTLLGGRWWVTQTLVCPGEMGG